MLRNYFKITWRNLTKQKMYSSIKIGGFALGIAACMLIALFIRDELSYDRQYPNGDRIYRVVGLLKGADLKDVDFPAPFASALKEDYPDIEQVCRINPNELFGAGSNEIRRADKLQYFYEDGFTYADQNLLNIFHIPMIYGNREQALLEPNSIVISKRISDKYFPNENPVGKSLVLNGNDSKPYKIGGVMNDFPHNSHLQYNFLITLTGREFWQGEQKFWGANNYHTYILLRKGANVMLLEKKLLKIMDKYYAPLLKKEGKVNFEEELQKYSFKLQPVSDIHLKSDGIYDKSSHGDIHFVFLFGAIAVFILILACINFINLSTAKSVNRAREVGLRKVVGSTRYMLMKQFLADSLIFSFLSFGSGVLLARLFLPFFNSLSRKSLVFPWSEWWVIPILVVAAVVVGIMAGLYPSFYLSGFKPIHVLKGKFSQGSKSSNLRSGLVIFQFAASIVLIIGTLIIYRQMDFILNKKLGFNKEQVVLIQGTGTLGERINPFKQELLKLSEVKSVSISDYLPIKGTKRNGNSFWKEGKVREEKYAGGQFWRVDHDYIKTLGIKIVDGRDFSSSMPTDAQGVIINQAMAKELSLENPVGKRITNGGTIWTVIGVVQNFHFESLRENIGGLCMVLGESPSIVSVKISTSDMSAVLQDINKVWKGFSPNQSIRYTFLDESFAMMYADVQRMGRIFTSFAILAILVACLGLFGLSSFMIEQRTKEIGIRKVNGARTVEVSTTLNKDFLIWIIIAYVIACPIAWYAMHKWLENFVYKTEINWWIFAVAGGMAVVIALLTVSWQSWKAAMRNPVEALRYE
jgi:putative ABC transport system permease protein